MPWLAELVDPGRSNRSSQATGRILPRRDVYRADRPGGIKRRREQNIDIRVIQALYTRVASNTIREVMSPLDRLTPLTPKKNEPRDTPPA